MPLRYAAGIVNWKLDSVCSAPLVMDVELMFICAPEVAIAPSMRRYVAVESSEPASATEPLYRNQPAVWVPAPTTGAGPRLCRVLCDDTGRGVIVELQAIHCCNASCLCLNRTWCWLRQPWSWLL